MWNSLLKNHDADLTEKIMQSGVGRRHTLDWGEIKMDKPELVEVEPPEVPQAPEPYGVWGLMCPACESRSFIVQQTVPYRNAILRRRVCENGHCQITQEAICSSEVYNEYSRELRKKKAKRADPGS